MSAMKLGQTFGLSHPFGRGGYHDDHVHGLCSMQILIGYHSGILYARERVGGGIEHYVLIGESRLVVHFVGVSLQRAFEFGVGISLGLIVGDLPHGGGGAGIADDETLLAGCADSELCGCSPQGQLAGEVQSDVIQMSRCSSRMCQLDRCAFGQTACAIKVSADGQEGRIAGQS